LLFATMITDWANLSVHVMCRGFGFVTFVNPTSVDKVLAAGVHQLDAKVVSRPSTTYILFSIPRRRHLAIQPN